MPAQAGIQCLGEMCGAVLGARLRGHDSCAREGRWSRKTADFVPITLSDDCPRAPIRAIWARISKELSMLRRIVTYGPAGGAIAIALLISTMFLPGLNGLWSMAAGYLAMLIGLTAIFLAIKQQRDETQGGVIGFFPALGMGLAISFIAGIVYALGWEIYMAATHDDFGAQYAQMIVAHAKAHHASGAALAKAMAEAADFQRQYANPFYRLSQTFIEIFPVGVLVSLISAALLRNSRFMPARR
jgi:hypothetical protein